MSMTDKVRGVMEMRASRKLDEAGLREALMMLVLYTLKEQASNDVDENLFTEDATVDSLGLDSLDELEVVVHLEDEFDIEITDEDAEKLKTPKAFVEYLMTGKVE